MSFHCQSDVLYLYKNARDAGGAVVLYLANASISPLKSRDDLVTFEVWPFWYHSRWKQTEGLGAGEGAVKG